MISTAEDFPSLRGLGKAEWSRERGLAGGVAKALAGGVGKAVAGEWQAAGHWRQGNSLFSQTWKKIPTAFMQPESY